LRTLAVVGPNATARRIQGGGSSQVRTDRRTSILAALRQRLGDSVEVMHADGGDNEPVPPAAKPAQFSPEESRGQAGLLVEYFPGRRFDERPVRAQPERQLGKLVSHNLGAGQPATYGALRWSGWYWPERDGRHEFSLRGPGDGRLWLDGASLIGEAAPLPSLPTDIVVVSPASVSAAAGA